MWVLRTHSLRAVLTNKSFGAWRHYRIRETRDVFVSWAGVQGARDNGWGGWRGGVYRAGMGRAGTDRVSAGHANAPPLRLPHTPPHVFTPVSHAQAHTRASPIGTSACAIRAHTHTRGHAPFMGGGRCTYSVSSFVKYFIPFLKYKISLSQIQDFYSKLERSETNNFKGVLSILVYI